MTTATATPYLSEVVRNRLDVIADEMETVLLRSSHSIVIKEGGDATCAIFDAAGEALAHAVAIPLHLGALRPAMTQILARYADSARDGDVYVMNDPYDGGTHLPDVIVCAPVFHDGRLIALTAALSHHQDIGGMVFSSMPAHATEVFQEGLIIPPVRLYEADRLNDDVLRLVLRNVRLPQSFRGDLDAQVAAVLTGRRRLLELIADVGFDAFAASTVELLDRSERMTRTAIAAIAAGTYRFHDYLDHDGIELGRKIRIEAAVTVGDGDFTVDFTGTDPQCAGPVNAPPSTAFSAVAYVLRALSDAATPINGGSERPIRLILPEGTLVNPVRPAPVSLRAHAARRIVDVLLGALVEALPDRIPACSASINGAFSYAGIDPRTGHTFAITDTNIASGMGALPDRDGTDVLEMHTTNLLSIPVEALELAAPVLVHRHLLRADSGGAGRFRGGLGAERALELLRGAAVSSLRHERHETSPWGLNGGGDGARWVAKLSHPDGSEETLPGKTVFEFRAGDVLTVQTGGGGGFGHPLQRSADAVLADWRDGKVTLDHARDAYGVVIDPKTRTIDKAETAQLRAARA
jgi:N-methylhydantoinase B